MASGFRIERDSMGELEVPASALWGAQTQRAVNNFPISGIPLPARFIRALGLIKWAAAKTNLDLGLLDANVAAAIQKAALEVAAGKHLEQFPIDIFQTGSGTSSNMNANEVIAHLASAALGKAVHPNDHVNMCQSSNDVIPSAIHVSAALAVSTVLLPALAHLADAIETKAGVLEKMAGRLEKDGFLFLGGAETVLGLTDKFVLMPEKRGLYVQPGAHGSSAVAPPTSIKRA